MLKADFRKKLFNMTNGNGSNFDSDQFMNESYDFDCYKLESRRSAFFSVKVEKKNDSR